MFIVLGNKRCYSNKFLWQVFIYHGQTLRLWNRDFQAILSIKTKSKNKLNSIRSQFKLRLMMQGRAVS